MTFEEMKEKYDKVGAFSDFISVERAKIIGLLPEAYTDIFPDNCSCGSNMIINFARTKLTCCDPHCPIKQGLALSELFSRFNIKGIADATCSDVYKMLNRINTEKLQNGEDGIFISNSYIEILLLDTDIYPLYFQQSAVGLNFLNAVYHIKSVSLTFSEMVSKLGLPEFDSTAYKLFSEFNSFQELMGTIQNEGGVSKFCDNRGVYSLQKKYWLQLSLPDIAVASYIFNRNIRMTGLKQLDICITGSLTFKNCKYTKNAYVQECNEIAKSRPLTEILKEALTEIETVNRSALIEMGKILGGTITPNDSQQFTTTELCQFFDEMNLPSIQVMEIRMTTARKSVKFIVADRPSNSAKYLEGVRRGEEFDETGKKYRVLVTSDELAIYIKEKVDEWEKELINQCRQLMTNSTEKMTVF